MAVSVYPLAVGFLSGQRLPADIAPTLWDGFHDLIVIDEIARCGYLGVIWALTCGNSIGGPPLINFGSEEQKRRLLPDLIAGRSRFCLGVTEPDGMSLADILPRFHTRLTMLTLLVFKRARMLPISPLLLFERVMCTLLMVQRNGSQMVSSQTTALRRLARERLAEMVFPP
jgi:hypothetical protein